MKKKIYREGRRRCVVRRSGTIGSRQVMELLCYQCNQKFSMWNFYLPVAFLSSCGMLNDKGSGQTVKLHFCALRKRGLITKPFRTLCLPLPRIRLERHTSCCSRCKCSFLSSLTLEMLLTARVDWLIMCPQTEM